MNDRYLRTGLALFMTLSASLSLAGCSTTSEAFDCKEGKGVGCKSISQVNKMVDEGVLGADRDQGPPSALALATPVISATFLSSGPEIALSDDMSVHRIREEHLRVWIAPFQDEQGNLHEGTIVHTVLKPGFWHIKGEN